MNASSTLIPVATINEESQRESVRKRSLETAKMVERRRWCREREREGEQIICLENSNFSCPTRAARSTTLATFETSKVKYWATLNEPNTFSINGYADGIYAPGHCSMYIGNCTSGNSATEPYQVMHNLLLAHASAVKLYKHRYQESQKGVIGLTTSCNWFTPFSNSTEDLNAAARAWDFKNGWYSLLQYDLGNMSA
ncbi:Vicianin hydrolase-like protein [Drosera capensis]